MKLLGESVSDMLKTPPFNKLSENDRMLAAGCVSGLVLAYTENARRFEGVKEAFELLTDAQRLELVHSCCTECGAKNDGCECWNDE